MNDYSFGNYIYERRKQSGDSQNELGQKLGVTGKAVSKWENGAAKPTTDILRKLAALWDIQIDDLLQIRERKKKMSICKIVITGGPCAGKTTGMSWIQNAFTERGYTVLFIPETAAELISGGVAPWSCRVGMNDYRKEQDFIQYKGKRLNNATYDEEKILEVYL